MSSAWGSSGFDIDLQIDGDDPANPVESHGTMLCVAEGGSAYVAWLDDRGSPGTDGVWLNRALVAPELAESWSWEPMPVAGPAPSAAEDVVLACDASGVLVAWRQTTESGDSQWWLNASEAGASFSPEGAVLLADRASSHGAIHVVRRNGVALVAWVDAARNWWLSRSPDGGATFAPPQLIAVNVLAPPDLAVDEDGQRLLAAWRDHAGISTRTSLDGGSTFRIAQPVEAAAESSGAPQVCGLDTVLWQASTEQGRVLRAAVEVEGVWQTVARVAPGPVGPHTADCASPEGATYAVWREDRDGAADLMAAVLSEDGFGEPIQLDVGPDPGVVTPLGTPTGLVLAVNRNLLLVAWHDDRDVAPPYVGPIHGDVYYQYVVNGALGGNADEDYRVDSMFDGMSGKADVQFASLGSEWFAAWTDHRGGTGDVFFQNRAIGEESHPPSRALFLSQGRGCGG